MGEGEDKALFEAMVEATVAGDEERCVALAEQAVGQGLDLFRAIREGYSRGMQIIGDRFGRLECYLPQVVLSADAMTAALAKIKPHLLGGGERTSEGVIVLGTIQGDIHDLGKNIVKIMLQAAGFEVHDLGNDVPVRRFIEKAEETAADIIAASAILTTTMSFMPDMIATLKELGLRDKYRVMVGGAPVIAQWAGEIGADGYGEDALAAVEVARRLMRGKERGDRS